MATENIEALEPTLRATLRTQITNEYGIVKTLRQEAEMTIAELIDVGTLATDQDVIDNGGGGGGASLDTDPTLSGDSDEVAPSQKAIKAYVDALQDATNALVFKGNIECSGEPDYPAASAGHTYRVSGSGKIGGGSGVSVTTGAILICIVDGSSSGNQATVGSRWTIIQVLSGTPLVSGGALGQPSSGNLSQCTNYSVVNLAGIPQSVIDALQIEANNPGGFATIPNS